MINLKNGKFEKEKFEKMINPTCSTDFFVAKNTSKACFNVTCSDCKKILLGIDVVGHKVPREKKLCKKSS